MVARPRRVVFVIDADDDTRVTHETILRAEGYEILSAADGARALTLLREEATDLVLLGGKIGPMGVLRLIQLMRSDVALKGTRVAVYGESVDSAAREELLRAGASAVISMPVSPHELVRTVVSLIGRA